ncbi:unnamed protein product [Symbiodinium sp. CCMP2456]|nr:unnamed protein product [Symbiodinium sp. CCMP2456]
MAGAYAVQAMEGEGTWSADTSLQVIAASRVREWRQKHRVQGDSDFAFYFTNYEQAVRQAGHHVADAWTVVRAEQEGCLISAASMAVEGPLSSRERPPLPRPSAAAGRKGRIAPPQPDGGDLRDRRQRLAAALVQVGAFRPAGPLTDALRREWERAVDRTVSRFVDRADRSTIEGVLSTWGELSAWQRARSHPLVPEIVDVYSFLAEGTPAPARALACLKWLVKKAKLDLDLADVEVGHGQGRSGQPRGQAPCVGPDMLGSWRKRSSWLTPTVTRSGRYPSRVVFPRQLFMVIAAGRGKQAHLRISGFDFAICSRFSSGWSWAEAWLREWEALTPLAKKRAGICFNRDGKPWAISEINLSVQEIFSDMLQEPADMTTYSWRRLLPTVGQLLRLSPQEQLALGDWASNNPEGNQMPLHYSSARYTTSLRFKALSLAAAWEVRGFEVDDVIVGDRTTIYQAPVTTEALHRSLALTSRFALAFSLDAATWQGMIAQEPGPSVGAGKRPLQAPAPRPKDSARVPEPARPPPKKLRSSPALPIADEPASEGATGSAERGRTESWRNYFDRLATAGGRDAQARTEIWRSGSGGRLFLAGLPTSATAQHFSKVALQVTCFDKTPEQRGGVLLQGEDVLYRCMAGRHATYAGLVRALLAFESLPVAYDHIKSLRDVEPEKVLKERFVGDFVHHMRRSIKIGQAAPAPTTYLATALSNVHIATNDIPLCKHNQAPSKALRLRDAWSTSDREEAVGWGISFCKACLKLSPASWHPR